MNLMNLNLVCLLNIADFILRIDIKCFTEDKRHVYLSERSYHSFSSLQRGFCSTSERDFTEAPSLFPDRSNSLRCEGFDLRAEAKAAKPLYVTPQSLNL